MPSSRTPTSQRGQVRTRLQRGAVAENAGTRPSSRRRGLAQWHAPQLLSHHRVVPKFEKRANAMHAESRLMPLRTYHLHRASSCTVRLRQTASVLQHMYKRIRNDPCLLQMTNFCQLFDSSAVLMPQHVKTPRSLIPDDDN
jgi:hypothetical protein